MTKENYKHPIAKAKKTTSEVGNLKFFAERIKNDLIESRINWSIAFLFIPVAFLTYLFHEFGHWLVGEVLGNDMILSLNNATSRSEHYINQTHNLYISLGGPVFTILQAAIFLVVIEITKSIYAFPFVFFASFSRFFSIVFGGFSLQDEARITSLLGIGTYSFAVIVILILFIITWRSCYLLKLNLKGIGYYTTLSTLCILIVIGLNKLIM
jgi:hypothetical protein